MKMRYLILALVLILILATACSGDDMTPSGDTAADTQPAQSGNIESYWVEVPCFVPQGNPPPAGPCYEQRFR